MNYFCLFHTKRRSSCQFSQLNSDEHNLDNMNLLIEGERAFCLYLECSRRTSKTHSQTNKHKSYLYFDLNQQEMVAGRRFEIKVFLRLKVSQQP